MDYIKLTKIIFIVAPLLFLLVNFKNRKIGGDKNLSLFIQIIILVAIIPIAYSVDDAMGGGKIRYILPVLIISGLLLAFFPKKDTPDSNSEQKLPPIPANTKLTKEKVSELLNQGYSFQEIHKGLDEPIGSIIKSTNKYLLAFFIFLLFIIIAGVVAVIVLH